MSRQRFVRWAMVLIVLGVPALAASQQPADPYARVPMTGKAGPGLETFDRAVLDLMDRHGIPGAALAIARDGKLVYARGFGWSDISSNTAVKPDTLFGMASISKPITAMAVLKLVEDGKLRLDEPAFRILKDIGPPRGARVDPRIHQITVRQLLNHTGGWSRSKSGDPIGWTPLISRAFRVRPPITPGQFISYMYSVRLDFDPGTQYEYSNVGYAVLAQIVRQVSGQSYEDYVRKNVLEPMGVRSARLHLTQGKYYPGEAKGYLAGTVTEVPPLQLPMMQGSIGWSVSVVEMIRFLTALDGSRGKGFLKPDTFKAMLAAPPPPLKPRANGAYNGLGFHTVMVSGEKYEYLQDGHYYGMRAFMKRNLRGVNWILTFNVSMQPDTVDTRIVKDAVQRVRERVESIKEYPKVDLFKEFP
jgi:N-acyl-D-amino-acid deacylase